MAKQSMMTQMTRITLEQIRHSERVAPEKNCSRIILIKKMEKHDSGLKSLKKCKYGNAASFAYNIDILTPNCRIT